MDVRKKSNDSWNDAPRQKGVKSREEKSVIFMQNDKNNIGLVSYFDRKKSGEKNVILLTTMHGTLKVTNSERKKNKCS